MNKSEMLKKGRIKLLEDGLFTWEYARGLGACWCDADLQHHLGDGKTIEQTYCIAYERDEADGQWVVLCVLDDLILEDIDSSDLERLDHLLEDGRISYQDAARRIDDLLSGLSLSSCFSFVS
jgi:hypothetical protein